MCARYEEAGMERDPATGAQMAVGGGAQRDAVPRAYSAMRRRGTVE